MQICYSGCLSGGVSRHQNSLKFKKSLKFIRRVGGSAFFKDVWNSKMSQRSEGGWGSTLIGSLSQIFSFFSVTPPLSCYLFPPTKLNINPYIFTLYHSQWFFILCMSFSSNLAGSYRYFQYLIWIASWQWKILSKGEKLHIESISWSR